MGDLGLNPGALRLPPSSQSSTPSPKSFIPSIHAIWIYLRAFASIAESCIIITLWIQTQQWPILCFLGKRWRIVMQGTWWYWWRQQIRDRWAGGVERDHFDKRTSNRLHFCSCIWTHTNNDRSKLVVRTLSGRGRFGWVKSILRAYISKYENRTSPHCKATANISQDGTICPLNSIEQFPQVI